MKILIVTQRYWPENFRITNIAESLLGFGHSVTVLTGLPMYPKGYIFDEYKRKKNRYEIHNGVHIIRVREFQRRNNILCRILNYFSFPFFGKKRVKKMKDDFDVVLLNELSPIICCLPGIKYAKKRNKKILMYEMDLWPESLTAGGIKQNSFIYKKFKYISGKIYSSCDKILVSTKEHIDYIKKLPLCDSLDIEYLPQYAEAIFNNVTDKKKNNIINIMFAGNVGKAQSVSTIVRAASIIKQRGINNVKFHIVGAGSELENCINLSKKMLTQNVIFYGHKNIDDMPALYDQADVMIVSLENKMYANMTIPGKVQSYMAAGKPIIACANGSCANFIIENKIGFTCEAQNYEKLADLICDLNRENLLEIGRYGRKKYLEKYSQERFMEKLNLSLIELTKNKNSINDK